MKSQVYRGRLAPSPTGHLHIGHALTFLFAARRAKQARGRLIYRDEDLDPKRCQPEFSKTAMRDLQKLGIAWQEGPDKGGPFAPYRQSKRQAMYEKYFYKLLLRGYIYPCPYSRKQIAAHQTQSKTPLSAYGVQKAKNKQEKNIAAQSIPNKPLSVPGEPLFPVQLRIERTLWLNCLNELQSNFQSAQTDRGFSKQKADAFLAVPNQDLLQSATIDKLLSKHLLCVEAFWPKQTQNRNLRKLNWKKLNWRFLAPKNRMLVFEDGRLGTLSFQSQRDFGDFLVWRKEGVPSYELAVVVDDALMQITEIVRGEDLLLSTARQLLLYEVLEWMPPAFYHTPLLYDKSGRKLSKRDGNGNLYCWIEKKGSKALSKYLKKYMDDSSI